MFAFRQQRAVKAGTPRGLVSGTRVAVTCEEYICQQEGVMRLHVSRRGMPVWLSLVAMMVLGLGAGREAATVMGAQQRSVPSDPERAALMRKHFDQALAIKDAVIRGDLAAVNSAAAALAAQDAPQGLPSVAGPFVITMKEGARRAAAATTLVTAASESASILATCGNCHQTVGIRPAFAAPPQPAAASAPGGVVGHMLDHQRAADLMLQGLIVPSTTAWREGADALNVARLRDRDLPRDSRWTPEIVKTEDRLHRFAGEAVQMQDPSTRARSYAQILATCAECHGLHQKVWGPSGR